MSKVLGIDLGTTNCAMGLFEGPHARILDDGSNRRTTPSIVAYADSGEVLVGEQARNQQVTNPAHTIYSIKRFMGRRHKEVASEEKLVPYEVVGKPDEFVQVRVGRHKHTPQAICAQILRHLKAQAEAQVGEPIDRAVITVPAYYNDSQRQATADAGELAGFTVERIINEPTAAALAYGIEQQGERRIVVFDLGGGTFDLSAMHIKGGEFRVLAVQGNTHLGGDDFDQRILDVVAEDFLRKTCHDVRQDPMALQRLKLAAQQAKVDLSTRIETSISVPFIAIGPDGPKHLNYTLTRDTFEQVCADLLGEMRDACINLLRSAGLGPSRIDDVVMVGGATRIPAVQTLAKQVFQRELLSKSINPDEVVATGAALLGGVLQGDLHNVHLMDVTSHGFGVEAAGGKADILIRPNTPIPTTAKKIFSTPTSNQTSVPINVLEGESGTAIENRVLGLFRLTGIRRAPRGVPRIEVRFEIDANGILNVAATDLDTGRQQKIVVTGGFGLDEIEKKRARADVQEAGDRSEQKKEGVELRNHAERIYADMRQWLQYNHAMLAPRAVSQLERVLKALRKGIERDHPPTLKAGLKKLDELAPLFRKAV